jgi:3-hydroxyacyl-[acyl-carrier-protein] dehydratase
MLLEGFYTIEDFSYTDDQIRSRIKFREDHPIFEGHFPGHPIVPGVCMVQIIRALTEKMLAEKLRIQRGDQLKFLKFIDPRERSQVDATVSIKPSREGYAITASLFDGDDVLFKFTGFFQRIA